MNKVYLLEQIVKFEKMIAEAKNSDSQHKEINIEGENLSDAQIPSTVEEFELWLLEQPELADKRFEFVEGRMIEKEGMKPNEFFIAKFLSRLFTKTSAYNEGDELIPEGDSYISDKRKRIPDIAYWTMSQIEEAKKGTQPKPNTFFAIEILSPNDSFQDVAEKIGDYFSAGTKLVWYILPKQEQIYVYTAPTKVTILKDDDICTAEPVLSDFSFAVKEMFE